MIGSRKRGYSHGATWCSDLVVCEMTMVLPTCGHLSSVYSVHDATRIVPIHAFDEQVMSLGNA